MTISLQVALWAIGIIFAGGMAYADLKLGQARLEKMLGNGVPGVFPRREEVKLLIQEAIRRD